MLFSSAETSFSAAQNRSKKMANKTVNNATNAMNAVNDLAQAKNSIRNNCGKPTPKANKPQHN